MNRHDGDRKRRHPRATSKAMLSHAAAMTCPACGRRNALRHIDLDAFTPPVFWCRYCAREVEPARRAAPDPM